MVIADSLITTFSLEQVASAETLATALETNALGDTAPVGLAEVEAVLKTQGVDVAGRDLAGLIRTNPRIAANVLSHFQMQAFRQIRFAPTPAQLALAAKRLAATSSRAVVQPQLRIGVDGTIQPAGFSLVGKDDDERGPPYARGAWLRGGARPISADAIALIMQQAAPLLKVLQGEVGFAFWKRLLDQKLSIELANGFRIAMTALCKDDLEVQLSYDPLRVPAVARRKMARLLRDLIKPGGGLGWAADGYSLTVLYSCVVSADKGSLVSEVEAATKRKLANAPQWLREFLNANSAIFTFNPSEEAPQS